MSYAVKEMFLTLQGEGRHTGRAAVFCRFAGCNLWSGKESQRGRAVCSFCDTDFVGTDGPGGGRFASSRELATAARAIWDARATGGVPYVVCTGGEPLLQLDAALVQELKGVGFEVGVETNGTQEVVAGLDWICVSPKANTELVIQTGDELKLVYPQPGLDPEQLSTLAFKHFYLQPMDGPEREDNIQGAIAYCLAHPQWRLSLQTHKVTGIP